MPNAIRHEIDFNTSAQRVYEALIDGRQFSAFTGAPAEIDGRAGGAFSCFGGIISRAQCGTRPEQANCASLARQGLAGGCVLHRRIRADAKRTIRCAARHDT